MIKFKDRLCQHFRSLGVKAKDSARFSTLVNKWVESNGEEWTVKRMKSLVSALKESLATGHYIVPEGWATKKNYKGIKIVKDGLVHRFLCAKTDQELFLANTFFRSYTLIMIDGKPTKTQLEKFNTAVFGLSEPNYDRELVKDISTSSERFFTKLVNTFPDYPEHLYNVQYTPLVYVAPNEKTSPCYNDEGPFHDLEIYTSKRSNPQTKSLYPLMAIDSLSSLWAKFPMEVSETILGKGCTHIPPMKVRTSKDVPAGTLGFIQEPGCKCRIVASPALSIQAIGEPLKRKLEFISSKIKWMYTFDHQKGRETTQEWLKKGKTVYAYDASSFTDRFPVDLQLEVLRVMKDCALLTQFDYEVAKSCSKLKFKSEYHSHLVQYTAGGQPMGWGPSFHLAALTHAILAWKCCRLTGQNPVDTVSIIGDDINICHEATARHYVDFMSRLGVDINLEKSVISDKVSEFAGKIITKDIIIPTIKLKPGRRNQEQLVKLLDFYPRHFWNNLTPEDKKRAIHAILPEYLGGIRMEIPKDYKQKIIIDWDNVTRHQIQQDIRNKTSYSSHASVSKYLNFVQKSFEIIQEELPSFQEMRSFITIVSEGNVQIGLSESSGMYYLKHQHENHADKPVYNKALTINDIIVSSILTDIRNQNDPSVNKKYIRKRNEFSTIGPRLSHHQKAMVRTGLPVDLIKHFMDKHGYIFQEFEKYVKTQYSLSKVYSSINNNSDYTNNQKVLKEAQSYGKRNENKFIKFDNSGEQPDSRDVTDSEYDFEGF